MISFRQISYVITITLIIFIIFIIYFDQNELSFYFQSTKQSISNNINNNNINIDISNNSATSGQLFNGNRIRYYDTNHKLFSNYNISNNSNNNRTSYHYYNCNYWGVVTTIFEPTDAMYKLLSLRDWCLVIVGDKKGPQTYNISASYKYIYLNVTQQLILSKKFPFANILPWNHFGRKNLGYLYAIIHGAKLIFDFDDDNELLGVLDYMMIPHIGSIENLIFNQTYRYINVLEPINLTSISYNVYSSMGSPSPCWPRGYPLDNIKSLSNHTLQHKYIDKYNIGVIQSLANHDPDVDAIYRLTMKLPFDFNTSLAESKDNLVLIPSNTYSPFNAQATLFFYSSFWALLLPVTIHGRVSDIWRGYLYQRLARDYNFRLVFSPAIVLQFRNVHNYLADFDSEQPLYKESSKLLSQLDEWHPSKNDLSLPGRIEELWIMMYEHGYIEINDVQLVQSWIESLIHCNYRFPDIKQI